MPTKYFINDFIPPIIFRWCQRFRNRKYGFSGNYPEWKNALKECRGYDSPLIFQKVHAAALKVKRGEAVYERDSVLFDEVQYSWPLLAGLLRVASQSNGSLNIIDFGGSLGSTYFQNRMFLQGLPHVRWNIVEQKHFVDAGKKDFEDEHLKFYYDLDSCLAQEQPNAILLSSTLPYLENPYGILNAILGYKFQNIIVDRTPLLLTEEKDRLTIQTVSPDIYPASYPAWFFNRSRFLGCFMDSYNLIAEFDALAGRIDLRNPNAPALDRGFILQRKK